LTETSIRNESGGTDGIGLLLDMARESPTSRLFWGETAWWMTKQKMTDLLHEGGTQPSGALGVVEKNQDGAVIGETKRGTGPQLGVTERLPEGFRKLFQL
jgi:hypothetical protein